jgi:hypothetical protein
MTLHDILFGGACIQSFDSCETSATLVIKDDENNGFEIVFKGITDVHVIDDIQHEIIHSVRIKRCSGDQRIIIINDNLEEIIRITFASAVVTEA